MRPALCILAVGLVLCSAGKPHASKLDVRGAPAQAVEADGKAGSGAGGEGRGAAQLPVQSGLAVPLELKMQASAADSTQNYTITASIAVTNKGRDATTVGAVRVLYSMSRAVRGPTFADAVCVVGGQAVRPFTLQPGGSINCNVAMPLAKSAEGVPTMPGSIVARAYRPGYATQGDAVLASSSAVELPVPGPALVLPYSLSHLTADIRGVSVTRDDSGTTVTGTLVVAYHGINTLPVTSRTIFLVEDGTNAMTTAVPRCSAGLAYPHPLARGQTLECAFELTLHGVGASGWLWARVGAESAGGYIGGQVLSRQMSVRLA
ncbi:MAG: hypothetical protein J3K34DRAFT_436731 [Monoraphidium minutum]|nr:MAG: hypothetical protein J3K34DRAFT_436731 [Monoraphidium minutum]